MVRGKNFDIWQCSLSKCYRNGEQIEKLPRIVWPRYRRIGARFPIIPKSGIRTEGIPRVRLEKSLESEKVEKKRRKRKEIRCHLRGCGVVSL